MATTRPLADPPDLIATAGATGPLFWHAGGGFAGIGVEAELTIEVTDPGRAAADVQAFFDAIAHDGPDDPGLGAVALGSVPFDRTRPATFVVPATVVRLDGQGRAWQTTIHDVAEPPSWPSDHDLDIAEPPSGSTHIGHIAADGSSAVDLLIDPDRPAEDWCRAVAVATGRLSLAQHQKVVLARSVRVRSPVPFVRSTVLERLHVAYPAAYLFALDGFVGASPELLVARFEDTVRSQPMAGTAPRGPDPHEDARLARDLLRSTKDREEHQITIDMVHDTLLPWCSYLDWEPEPAVIAMANVQHLATTMEGRLSAPWASVIELMAALHPTPAVGGNPRSLALDMIAELEVTERGPYAGPVGWVDRHGNGEFAVGIRSAILDGNEARCFSGVGVVSDSDPEAELAETEAKLAAMLGALGPPDH